VVFTQRIEAVVQLGGEFLLGKTLPGIVIAENDRLVDRQVGDATHHLDILIAQVADKQRQIRLGALKVSRIDFSPATVDIADGHQGGRGAVWASGHGVRRLASGAGQVAPQTARFARLCPAVC
jgi:hypothetical protein